MAQLRKAGDIVIICLSKERKEQIEKLLRSWIFEDKIFVKGILKSHLDCFYASRKPAWSDRFVSRSEAGLEILKEPAKLKNQNERVALTGEPNAKEAFEKIFKTVLTYYDAVYLLHRLEEEAEEAVIPDEFIELFYGIYLVHLRKELGTVKKVPKKSLVLVTGPTGSGKTFTIQAAIEKAILRLRVLVWKDFEEEKARILEFKPWYMSLPFANWIKPAKELEELEEEEFLRRHIERYKRFANFKLLKWRIFKKYCQAKLKKLREIADVEIDEKEGESLEVDYDVITPRHVQTEWYGKTGELLEKSMGSPNVPTIRHIMEAHGVLVDPGKMRADDIQARTLSTTANIAMDEIIKGARQCFLIADTHSPGDLAPDTYRRFDELGAVIDMSQLWMNKKYVKRLIELEARWNNIYLDEDILLKVADRVYGIFREKTLTVTPSYVRKMISTMIEQKGGLRLEYFNEESLIRTCFKNVARHAHADLYKKVVKEYRGGEGYSWDDYQGSVKDDFAEKMRSALFYASGDKGAVLIGPPGSGKTFLVQVVAAAYPDITYISAKPDDLSEEWQPIEAMIRNLDVLYTIGKMLAPSLIVINEADAICKQRNPQMPNPYDKVANKYLDILDGEESIKGTFTVWTTNMHEELDKAATRPGRLDIMVVDGKLFEKQVANIIEKEVKNEPRDKDLGLHDIYEVAKAINNVPAGYVDFVRKMKGLRNTDVNIIVEYKKLFETGDGEKLNEFIKYNAKTILRVLEVCGADSEVVALAKKDVDVLTESKKLIYEVFKEVKEPLDYKLKKEHLAYAKEELLKDPRKKAMKGLDEFLSGEMSLEPQVGKIVGAAYGDNIGFLVPINTILSPRSAGGSSIIVTGVTKGSVLQSVDFTEMTIQSAKEALALNIHYFQNLLSQSREFKRLDAALIIGVLLEKRSIHHQMESVNYMGGGPSAGFALSINTLSVLLNIPIYHDFGITGAPATRGVSKDKAGSSVIIGGEDKKAERVLRDLRRMYVPQKNYDAISLERQASYWEEGKIIIPVGDYRDVIPEVLYFGGEHHEILERLIVSRVDYNKKRILALESKLAKAKEQINQFEERLREVVELEIARRLISIYNFYHSPQRDEFTSLEAIFEE